MPTAALIAQSLNAEAVPAPPATEAMGARRGFATFEVIRQRVEISQKLTWRAHRDDEELLLLMGVFDPPRRPDAGTVRAVAEAALGEVEARERDLATAALRAALLGRRDELVSELQRLDDEIGGLDGGGRR